jgi:hypothetical protein
MTPDMSDCEQVLSVRRLRCLLDAGYDHDEFVGGVTRDDLILWLDEIDRVRTLARNQGTQIELLRAELQHVRAIFRVNMLRLAPETSHEEIDRVLSLKG